jgi:molybdopterin-guanine dinucleotide biosynthesis protein A
VSGILLAGGASARFGRDKLLEPVGGAPLFHRPLRALATVCDEVVVVIGPDAPAPPLPDVAVPVRVVRDELRHEGPLLAASVGLANARNPLALVAAGDMPGLRAPVLELLLARGQAGADAVALEDGDRWRPLPSLLRVAPARALGTELVERGERRLRALVGGLRPLVVGAPAWLQVDPGGDWRRDVDLPADLPGSPGRG